MNRTILSAQLFAGLAALVDTAILFLIAVPCTAIFLWCLAYLKVPTVFLVIMFVTAFLFKLPKYLKEVRQLKELLKEPGGTDA